MITPDIVRRRIGCTPPIHTASRETTRRGVFLRYSTTACSPFMIYYRHKATFSNFHCLYRTIRKEQGKPELLSSLRCETLRPKIHRASPLVRELALIAVSTLERRRKTRSLLPSVSRFRSQPNQHRAASKTPAQEQTAEQSATTGYRGHRLGQRR